VQTIDGLEQLLNPCRLTGHFLRCQICRYCFAELSDAADALGCDQRQHGLRISIQQLALLLFLNGPCRPTHMIYGIAELGQDAGGYASGPDRLLDFGKLRTGLSELEIHPPKSLTRI
jgi:hypothetical protein